MKTTITTTRGMTLLEITLASAILSVLMVISLMVSRSLTDASSAEAQIMEMNKVGTDIVKKLTQELQPAMVPSYSLAGEDLVTYLVPVDYDNDGDTLDSDMKVEWGSNRPDNATGLNADFLDKSWSWNDSTETWTAVSTDQTFTTTVRFVKTDTFSEVSRNIDLNQDGDTDDVFAIGRLDRIYSAGRVLPSGTWQDEVTRAYSTENIVQVDGNPCADISGNGALDPLFLISGSYLQITIYLANVTAEHPLLVKVTGGLEMRNM